MRTALVVLLTGLLGCPSGPKDAGAPESASAASEEATPSFIENAQRVRTNVPLAERACIKDEDCDAVRADCSNIRCIGVKKEFASHYAALDCAGYQGGVGNYDCQPRFHIEAPRCESGTCVSRRIKKP